MTKGSSKIADPQSTRFIKVLNNTGLHFDARCERYGTVMRRDSKLAQWKVLHYAGAAVTRVSPKLIKINHRVDDNVREPSCKYVLYTRVYVK